MAGDIRKEVTVVTKTAQKNLKDAAAEAKKLGTSLDDTQSAGKKLAAGMDAVTSKLESEFKQAKSAADKLETAIGKEGVEAFKKQGKSVDDLIQDLKRAELTYEEIEADTDALAASMKRLSQVGDSINTHVTRNMEGVVRQTDQAGRAMHGFAGNAVGDLAQTAAGFGPLGQGVGQLTEGLLAGEIGFGKLAAAAGGMAVAGLLITSVMGHFSKQSEDAKKQLEGIKEAQKAIADNEALAAAEKLEETYRGLYTEAKKYGISAETVTRALMGNEEALALVDEQLDFFTRGLTDTDEGYADVTAAADEYHNSIRTGAELWESAGNATEGAKDRVAEILPIMEETTTKVESLENAWNRLTAAFSAQESFDDVSLTLLGLGEELASIEEQMKSGEITGEEAWLKVDKAIVGAKEDVADYLLNVLKLPESQTTEVLALIDQGKFEEAQDKIDALTKARTVPVTVSASGSLSKSGWKGGAPQYRATGGPVKAGEPYVVGEKRPELFVPDQNGTIVPSVPSGQVYNDNRTINVLVPNQTPEATAQAVARYTRRNGL